MRNEPLITYLRAYRLRSGLSQDELAFLLGIYHRSTISRHEMGRRIPHIRHAIIYEMVVGVPMKELYANAYLHASKVVQNRARSLKRSLEKQAKTALRERKLAILNQLLEDNQHEK